MTSKLNVAWKSHTTWVIDVPGLFLTCYAWVFVQPGTGRRPVDWCRILNAGTVHRQRAPRLLHVSPTALALVCQEANSVESLGALFGKLLCVSGSVGQMAAMPIYL